MIANPGRAARRKLISGLFTGACMLATGVALVALLLILWSLLTQGLSGINLDIITKDTSAGGLRNAIVGSVMMCLVAMVFSVVVGILAGTWLAEIGGDTRYGHTVRFLNDVLLSAPSILVGVFVTTILVNPFGGASGWAGAVALAILATPVVTRTTEDILNLQPSSLREASMALGASQFVTVRRVIWKAAGAGLLTGGLLGFARISGETAPLLHTAGDTQFMHEPWWDIPGMMSNQNASLPVMMYNFALSPFEDANKLAWAGAVLLAFAVLGINVLGRWLAREKKM
ncbi:phosphate ABC transporter permease PstA [Asticcacaulis sp. AC460]|uniref:phosphate ABC transporter permease PstA n=1 Tax=Asticcacaulis sp. AC460 TaxID=1282360 RepID=UPI0004CE9AF3|nr:phosphate ABC transporter permease PstA [Asticcacaulis sp. AC460]